MEPLYLRLFFRIISRNREAYILKVITLAVAFASSLLISLFVLNEFGYDRYHREANSVFRILQRNETETFSGNRTSNGIPEAVLVKLKSQFGDSVTFSSVKILNGIQVRTGKSNWRDQKIHAVDPSIVDVFSFDIVDGVVNEFTSNKPTAILSATAAARFFGTSLAAGETLQISSLGNTIEYSVTAVFADFPKTSHEQFDVFINADTSAVRALNFDPKVNGVYGRVFQREISHYQNVIANLFNGQTLTYILQPVPEIYFGPRVLGEDARHGDAYSIYMLICITVLILFLALTSFMNLTTLTLPHRSKELAIKKMAGTSQFDLFKIFAGESILIVGIALALGLLLLVLASKWIAAILSIDPVTLLFNGDGRLVAILIVLSLVLAAAPLVMTSRFTSASPIRLLSSDSIAFPRFKRMIGFLQLGVSLFLIVSSVIMRRQITYSLVKEPGQNHDQIVYLNYPDHLSVSLNGLREALRMNSANVVDVIATSQLPDRINSKELNTGFYLLRVDPEFKNFFDLEMTHGNWFKANDGDSIFVVSEKTKHQLGSDTTNLIGTFRDLAGQFNLPERPLKISMSGNIKYNFLCIRVLEVDIRRTVGYLNRYFSTASRSEPLRFFNKRFEEWLSYQDRLNKLSETMAVISAILACCAIYGLCVGLVREKLKQIAIHKLFGAGTRSITTLLIKEFASQMGMAILFFGPLSYIVIQEILRNFVYRTHFVWLDPLLPLVYCGTVIVVLCGLQAATLNRGDLVASLKG